MENKDINTINEEKKVSGRNLPPANDSKEGPETQHKAQRTPAQEEERDGQQRRPQPRRENSPWEQHKL